MSRKHPCWCRRVLSFLMVSVLDFSIWWKLLTVFCLQGISVMESGRQSRIWIWLCYLPLKYPEANCPSSLSTRGKWAHTSELQGCCEAQMKSSHRARRVGRGGSAGVCSSIPCISAFSGSGIPGSIRWLPPWPWEGPRWPGEESDISTVNQWPMLTPETRPWHHIWPLRWTRHRLWDSPAKSAQREPIVRKRTTNLKWGTFYKITGLDTSKMSIVIKDKKKGNLLD